MLEDDGWWLVEPPDEDEPPPPDLFAENSTAVEPAGAAIAGAVPAEQREGPAGRWEARCVSGCGHLTVSAPWWSAMAAARDHSGETVPVVFGRPEPSPWAGHVVELVPSTWGSSL